MLKHRVLILGSGGREHTLAWKIVQSPVLEKLYIAPGNGGTAGMAENVELNPLDFQQVSDFILQHHISMLVVGPEEPLVKGICDFLKSKSEHHHLIIVGPSMSGARLEGSKAWAKEFMLRHRIPTARYKTFRKENAEEAIPFLKTLAPPYVIKASGLAAGKGVIITPDMNEAVKTINDMLNGSFGEAGSEVVIEEYLDGIEVSVFVLTDGSHYALLPEAKDYKRIGNQNSGPNTGGMGAVSPVPFAGEVFMQKVKQRVIEPTIEGLKKEGVAYTGFVFFGLIKVNDDPYVIEYNVRMGDPETQAVMPRLKSDLLALFVAMHQQQLWQFKVEIYPHTAVTVVLASGGYPGSYEKGFEISGENVQDKQVFVFHAGTQQKQGVLTTSGGRVMAVTAVAEHLTEAREKVYAATGGISFRNSYCRNDIGEDLL